jgi:hypothetical protein
MYVNAAKQCIDYIDHPPFSGYVYLFIRTSLSSFLYLSESMLLDHLFLVYNLNYAHLKDDQRRRHSQNTARIPTRLLPY